MAGSASFDQSPILICHHWVRMSRSPWQTQHPPTAGSTSFDQNLISNLVSLGANDQTTVADSASFDQSITFDLASLDTNEQVALTGSTSFDQGLTFDLMPLGLNGQVTTTPRSLQERRFSSNRTRYPSSLREETHFFKPQFLRSMSPQDAVKLVDWICQLDDFGRKGPENKSKWQLNVLGCEGIESKFVIALKFGQIKIGAFWSLPDSRFSAMCKEGQL
ncbi:hypothetical protein GQ457_12G028490 [Hibiscus cannabinus]